MERPTSSIDRALLREQKEWLPVLVVAALAVGTVASDYAFKIRAMLSGKENPVAVHAAHGSDNESPVRSEHARR